MNTEIIMAYCDKCGNYDESHRDSMDYEKDSHLEAQNYEQIYITIGIPH